jgi:exopolysaccharide biosynthesis polyprenyl glycosylphosphotransferase
VTERTFVPSGPQRSLPTDVQGLPPRPVSREHRSRDAVVRRALAAGDILAFSGGLSAGLFVRGDLAGDQIAWAAAMVPVWIVLLKLYGLYDKDSRRVSHSTIDDLPAIFHALLIAGLGTWVWLKITPAPRMVLAQALVFMPATLAATVLLRTAARRLARELVGPERVLLVGEGAAARVLVQKVRGYNEVALDPVGYLAGDRSNGDGLAAELPCLGEVGDLGQVCDEHGIERAIVVALSVEPEVLAQLIRDAHDATVKVSVLPHAFDVLGRATELDDVEGVTILGVNPPALSRSSRMLKRALDVTVSVPLLLLTLPLYLPIAVAITLDSGGPIMFRQIRIGRGGRPFRLFKFRTMVIDAEAQVEGLRALSSEAAWLALDHDPRVTRVGRFLRKASLDELPQLWNVVRGEMSLVGPRPMPSDVHDNITGWGRKRLDLTPGLTGLWQVLGRTRIPFDEMIKLDYLYVTNWSLWGDVRLLLKTLYVVLIGRGAN